MVSEIWVAKMATPGAKQAAAFDQVSLNDAAQCKRLGIERAEVFAVQVETAVGCAAWHWPIIRDGAGKGRLGERTGPQLMGPERFTGLLPRRPERVN